MDTNDLTQPLAPSKKRIEYIDAIRGFSILWVVVYHLGENVPDWLAVPYRMPLFFFVSGIFFKSQQSYGAFFSRRVNTLIVPFIFFYLLSWSFAITKYEIFALLFPHIGFEGIGSFREYSLAIMKLFRIHNENVHEPLLLNGPLWFLIALFNIQIIYYFLTKIGRNKMFILTATVMLYITSMVFERNGINGLFYIQYTFHFLLYYALGNLFGKSLTDHIDNPKSKRLLLVFGLPFLAFLPLIPADDFPVINDLLLNIRIACFIPVVFIFFKTVHRFRFFKPLQFFGRNSLILLGTHVLIFSLITSIFVKIATIFTLEQTADFGIFSAFLFGAVVVINYFLISSANKYIPWLIGKRDLIQFNFNHEAIVHSTPVVIANTVLDKSGGNSRGSII